jgi:hypothetical protein
VVIQAMIKIIFVIVMIKIILLLLL